MQNGKKGGKKGGGGIANTICTHERTKSTRTNTLIPVALGLPAGFQSAQAFSFEAQLLPIRSKHLARTNAREKEGGAGHQK